MLLSSCCQTVNSAIAKAILNTSFIIGNKIDNF